MNGEQGILVTIVLLSLVGVLGAVGVLATGGEPATAAIVLGFSAPTVASLLAVLKSIQTKNQSQENKASIEAVKAAIDDKTIVSTDDLPPSLGGGS